MVTYRRRHVLRRTFLPTVFVLLIVTGLTQGLAISGVQHEQKIREVNIPKDIESSGSVREAKFLNFKTLVSGQSNEIDTDTPTVKENDSDNPVTAFSGIYSDCISEFSFTCVQRKVLVFFDRLGRMDSFNLLGDFISVVRTRRDTTPQITEEGLKARLYSGGNVESDMDSLMDLVADRFFGNHVLRVRLPAWTEASVPGDVGVARTGTTVDISFANSLDEEGRGRKKRKGGKGMKKMMGMMGALMMGKMLVLAKGLLLLIKIKAIKALLIGSLALLLSKIQIIKKLMSRKGGGDHGGQEKHIIVVAGGDHGGGHGGGGHDSYGPPSGGGGGYGGGGGGYGGGGGGGHGGGDSYGPPSGGGWGGGGGGGGGWNRRSARSINYPEDSHLLAYRGHMAQ